MTINFKSNYLFFLNKKIIWISQATKLALLSHKILVITCVWHLFSLSNNTLDGSIPNSIYIASSLQVFDLSLNNIYGTIISCLMRMSVTLKVLNLKNNNLTGHIPYAISASCSLWILNLHGNLLDGPIPNSFSCCLKLKVLDLGLNQIIGGFPCF